METTNDVVHLTIKEMITRYSKTIAEPELCGIWQELMYKDLSRLAQGYGDTLGMDTI